MKCPECQGSGFLPGEHWFRPGPLMECRGLGRWPSAAWAGVWSDWLFAQAEALLLPLPPWHVLPEVGADIARFGDDWTAFHVRWGPCSVAHERHHGWSTAQTAGRLKQLCMEWAGRSNEVRARLPGIPPVGAEKIIVKVDSDGLGGGVVDQAGDYSFVGVSAAAQARTPDEFPNTRSELWFSLADLADEGRLSLARLDLATRRLLRRQALAPTWKVDAAGRCVVEPKEKTKERLGASPDDVDSMNLAYYCAAPFTKPPIVPDPRPTARPQEEGEAKRLGLFGKSRR